MKPAFLLLTLLLTFPTAFATSPESPRPETASIPNPVLSQPLPKEIALELFHRFFSLSPDDFLNWNESANSGRIHPDLTGFRNYLFRESVRIDPIQQETILSNLPSIDLPDGSRVSPILLESLGPNLRENLSQEDLNSLLPAIARFQQNLSEFETARTVRDLTENPFKPISLKPGDLTITLAQEEPSENTSEIKTGPSPDSPTYHFLMPPFLNGNHVSGARIIHRPFTTIQFELTETGSALLAETTGKHAGNLVGILLNGKFHATVAVPGRMETRHLQLPAPIDRQTAADWIKTHSTEKTETISPATP